MIETKNLSFSYSASRTFAFENIQTKGEPLLIIGPSGVGKTTLLHLLAGILPPKQGQVIWDNTPIGALSSSDLDQKRGLEMGLIFQKNHFIESLSVLENILLPSQINHLKINAEHLSACLESLGIQDKINQKPNALSEGEKQRANIARALLHRPKYVLADEPTSSLDDHNTAEVVKLLKSESAKNGSQLLIITHDQRLKSEFSQTLELK